MLLIVGCESKIEIQNIDKDKLINLMKNNNTVLIDVRTKEEFDEKHIDGAINIPINQLNDIKYSKDYSIIVYCKSGIRSNKAANELINLGYTHIYDFGSIDNW